MFNETIGEHSDKPYPCTVVIPKSRYPAEVSAFTEASPAINNLTCPPNC